MNRPRSKVTPFSPSYANTEHGKKIISNIESSYAELEKFNKQLMRESEKQQEKHRMRHPLTGEIKCATDASKETRDLNGHVGLPEPSSSTSKKLRFDLLKIKYLSWFIKFIGGK
jgi:hypothetical protein